MLAIRMQRTGRKGHAQFRVIVQDARRTPTSGKIVYALGSYNPHSKTAVIDKEKASFYLEHGAQPSVRVARLLKSEGVKLPEWVKLPADKERDIRNPEKRRSTAPAEAADVEQDTSTDNESPAEATTEEPTASEAPAEVATSEDASSEDTPAEEPAAEKPEKPPVEEEKAA